MINFGFANLDAMRTQRRKAGVVIDGDVRRGCVGHSGRLEPRRPAHPSAAQSSTP